jgi:YidC/Oxa1 family membrane protein insertase
MNKRIILAFVLAIAFFALYSQFILPYLVPKPAPPSPSDLVNPAAAPVESTAAAPTQAAPAPAPALESTAPASPQAAALPGFEIPAKYRQESIKANDEKTLSNDVLTVVFTARSGSVKTATLNKFANFAQNGPLVLLKPFTNGEFPTQITSVAGADVAGRLYALESVSAAAKVSDSQTIVYATVLDSGLKITKTYTLYPGKYGLELKITLENLTSPRSLAYELRGPTGVPSEDYALNDIFGVLASVPAGQGLAGKMDYQETPAAKLLAALDTGGVSSTPDKRPLYAGAVSRYFASVLRPDTAVPLAKASCYAVADSEKAKAILGDKDPVKTAEGYAPKERAAYLKDVFYTAGAKFAVGSADLGAAGSSTSAVTHSFILYCGPKDKIALDGFNDVAKASTGFQRLLDYGFFEPLVKVILYIMKVFHAVIPNWGIAIILLTLLVRVAMHPLTRKSQISMSKMQKLQPHIKKLQEKYKNDKQKLGQEQMKLMKEHGANPLGGCLPMLIQLPILWALYSGLRVSIELRHAPFYLIPGYWIRDLAQPDMLFMMPMALPILGSYLNLLPILMAAATALQQLWAPKPSTPEMAQQQKMMGIMMPVLMGVMFYSLASGLSLYFLTSTVAGIIEQWIIKRHIAAEEERAASPAYRQ